MRYSFTLHHQHDNEFAVSQWCTDDVCSAYMSTQLRTCALNCWRTLQFWTRAFQWSCSRRPNLTQLQFFLINLWSVLAYCVYVLKVASTDGLIPSLVASHCTIFIVNILFCYVLGKQISFSVIGVHKLKFTNSNVTAAVKYIEMLLSWRTYRNSTSALGHWLPG